jgi:SAM-dependent methyltransferase
MFIVWIITIILFISFGLIVFRGAPYVPTLSKNLDQAFELYPVDAGDLVVDLGSGDGAVLLAGVKRGARVVGYELNPFLALISRFRLRRFSKLAEVKIIDFWNLEKLPEKTTLVYIFGVGRDMQKLEKCLQRWADSLPDKRLHVISFGFTLKNQKPIRTLGAMSLYEA